MAENENETTHKKKQKKKENDWQLRETINIDESLVQTFSKKN